MPWAAENSVSTSEIEGGIEISQAQYAQAIEALTVGKLVTIEGGFAVVDPPEPEAPEPGPLTPDDVVAEQRRRLALGFDYDFGDVRGVHHIATTEQDMQDWQEVTTWATLMKLTGDTTATLMIATSTGIAEVTADDWLAVLAAGTASRQPIFQGAFWLMAQDPVPTDYATNEAYWSRN